MLLKIFGTTNIAFLPLLQVESVNLFVPRLFSSLFVFQCTRGTYSKLFEQNRSVFNPDVFKVNKHQEKNNLPTCMVLDKVNWQLSRSPYYTLFTFIVLHIHCFLFLLRSRPKEDNSFIQFLWIACVLWVMWKWCMIKHDSFNHFNVVWVSFSFVFRYLQIMKSSTIVLLFSIFVLCVAGKQFYLCIAVSNTASSALEVWDPISRIKKSNLIYGR